MSNIKISPQRITEGIIATPGTNTNLYYTKELNRDIVVNGAMTGLETPFDWTLIKPIDTRYIKSGIIAFNSDRDSATINFKSPFTSNDYYVFFMSNNNINLYWSLKTTDKFVIESSYTIGGEITWLAIDKKIKLQTGIKTPGTVFVGQRTLTSDQAYWDGERFIAGDTMFDIESLPMPGDDTELDPDCAINLPGWFKNEYIIKPNNTQDGIQRNMNFADSSSYSVLLSSNININTFWLNKATDRVKIGTSYPIKGNIDFLFIKTGLNWWEEV